MNNAMTETGPQSQPHRAAQPIRVFVADDHRVTLWGLQKLIEAAAPRFTMAGMAVSRQELLDHPALQDTDVLLLDLDLNGSDGAESIAELQRLCPGRILVLTAADNPAAHRNAVVKGARGVLHKSEPADTVLRAIEKVHAGEVWLHRSLLGEVLGTLTGPGAGGAQHQGRLTPEAARIASLTPREREIVGAMVRSAGAKQLAIAEELGMSEHTLRNHLTTIYSKLGVRGRLELHVYATEHKLGSVPPREAR